MKNFSLNLLNRNPLFQVFCFPVIVDVVGTVLGQPPEYWQGGYKVVNEALPIFFLLQLHPLVFIIFCLVFWLTLTYFLVLKLKYPLNVWATMALLAGHSYNSVAWLRIIVRQWGFFPGTDQLSQAMGLIPMTVYILLIGFLAMRGITHWSSKQTDSPN